MRVTAIVVARHGSRRVPGKALRPFGRSTLIGHAVDRLRAVPSIDEVIVGSDSREILEEAERHGATGVKRDAHHCDEDNCPANEMIADMATRVDADVIVWAHPTNPLIRPQTYEEAVRTFLAAEAAGDADSLLSVTRIQRHAWIDDVPLNFDPHAPRHQLAGELSPVHIQDGAIFIQRRSTMLANRYFYAERPVLFEVGAVEGTDIDTEEDLALAAHLLHLVMPGLAVPA